MLEARGSSRFLKVGPASQLKAKQPPSHAEGNLKSQEALLPGAASNADRRAVHHCGHVGLLRSQILASGSAVSIDRRAR